MTADFELFIMYVKQKEVEILKEEKEYIQSIGGFEKLAQWGYIKSYIGKEDWNYGQQCNKNNSEIRFGTGF